ncbi:tripartite tricarboxylate transporter TctB family protein [Paracoccus rhizosphaerae]|uniref:Tripartite tricarboxylate transporter TctB family protein n=1 Tax=Paracoccus rhizosphaerae TaxID=1133347 RepID=A0ABV6CKK5_9RHOB|nr:tripartite tricarboxylate transporter TctB family protein [Paracoccus rhizosphaerae]
MSDRILGGFGLALAAFYIWAATIIPDSFMSDAIGPKTFPIIIGIVTIICSIVFILKPDVEPHWPGLGQLAELGLAVAAMFAYAMFLPTVGFVIATSVATAYLTWRLGSRPLNSVVIGISTAIGIHVVFKLILGLSLARGPFGF